MTLKANVTVPDFMIEKARELWPETHYMTTGRILKYGLAKALGFGDSEAMAATFDSRIAAKIPFKESE